MTVAAPTTSAPARLAELDGIRGWASLVVLLFHVLPEISKQLLPELNSDIIALLLDGQLAVFVFFILSGEALSAGYLRTGNIAIVRQLAIRRYPRLTIPILLASSLVWLAMVTGLDAHRQGEAVFRSGWMGGLLELQPSFGGLLQYALHDVYFSPPRSQQYIPLLWTMPIEMLGSCVVFGLLALLHGASQRQRLTCLAAALLMLVLFDQMLVGFVLGIFLGEAQRGGWLDRARYPGRWRVLIILTVTLVVGLCCIRAWAHGNRELRYILNIRVGRLLGPLVPGWNPPLVLYANAFGLFLLVRLLPPLRRFFTTGLSRFLGRISFPLYLVQFPVLITLTPWLGIRFIDPAAPDPATVYGIAAAGAAASLLLAWGLFRVERIALRWANAATAPLLERERLAPGLKHDA